MKPTAAHSIPEGGLQLIPLMNITPNPNNPRKTFNQKSMIDLADSIKIHGVRQPILVRPHQDKFQIVFGERRWRASNLAELDTIPAIVDPHLTDQQALEISIFENLQREDVHPLEEAQGYETLIKMAAKDPNAREPQTAETIAAKLGKSVAYVYARLKLLALIPAAREAFELNRITPAHGVLIARLQPFDQVRALLFCFHQWGGPDICELKKKDPLKLKFKDISEDDQAPLAPEKALREWIQDNINLRLKDVPWDLADAALVPKAGACDTCQKRSTSNPGLFAELAVKGEDTCFDAECFQEKRAAFVQIQLSVSKHIEKQTEGDKPRLLQLSDLGAYTKAKPDQTVYRRGQWLDAKKGSCEAIKEGIMVRGEDAGKKKLVCIDPSCKVHKKHLNAAPRETQSVDPKKAKEAEEKRKREAEQGDKFRRHLFTKISSKLDGANRALLLLFYDHHLDIDGVWHTDGLLKLHGWKGNAEKVLLDKLTTLPIAKAYNLMAEIILWLDIGDEYAGREDFVGDFLETMAKAYKLDIPKLRKEFDKAQAPSK